MAKSVKLKLPLKAESGQEKIAPKEPATSAVKSAPRKNELPLKESGQENIAPKEPASAVKSARSKNAICSPADDKTLVEVLTEQQAAGNH
jgi:hypothetical protein